MAGFGSRTLFWETAGGKLVEFLAQRGPTTVRGLVDGLGVTTTAVRQQVDRLLRDGWLVRSRRHAGTGRPADVYALSQKGKQVYAGRTDVLAKLLLDELVVTCGQETARTVLVGVGRRLAESAQRVVGPGTVAERARRLAKLLGTKGFDDGERAGGNPRLSVYACPYAGVANGHPEVCEMERAMITRVLGVPVRRTQRFLDGHRVCEFELERGLDNDVAGG